MIPSKLVAITMKKQIFFLGAILIILSIIGLLFSSLISWTTNKKYIDVQIPESAFEFGQESDTANYVVVTGGLYIQKVVKDEWVRLVFYDLPPNETFTITMFSQEGNLVESYISGGMNSDEKGGASTDIFLIPEPLHGSDIIYVNLFSQNFNRVAWFYNDVEGRTFNINGEYPSKIPICQSDWIRIELILSPTNIGIPTSESNTRETENFSDVLPMNSSDLIYTMCLRGVLVGSSFDIEETKTDCQSLDQKTIVWEWIVAPKKDRRGPQVVSIDLIAVYEIFDDEIIRAISSQGVWSDRLIIEISNPIGCNIDIYSLIVGLIGSALSIPWIYDRFVNWKQFRKEREMEKPTTLLP